MPKFMARIKKGRLRNEYISKKEIMLRVNYMSSITWASFGLIFLLAFPYDGRLLSPLVLLAAIPYFLAMASDLKYCGYKRTDVFRIYGFNLILLLVNLAGVLKSIQQALSGKKIPFARTPKVKNRTASPAMYVLSPIIIIGFSILIMMESVEAENWGNAIFAGFNAITTSWATVSYIGIKNMVVDSFVGVINWLYVDAKNTKGVRGDEEFNWRAALYHGNSHESLPLNERAYQLSVVKRAQSKKRSA